MDKLGKVWTKFSTSRRSSQTRLTHDIDVECNAPVDTKKVFEIFGETSQFNNTPSDFDKPVASHQKHQSSINRETPVRVVSRTTKSPEAEAQETKFSQGSLPVLDSAPEKYIYTYSEASSCSSNREMASTSTNSLVIASNIRRNMPIMTANVEDIKNHFNTNRNSNIQEPTTKLAFVRLSPSLSTTCNEMIVVTRNNLTASPQLTLSTSSDIQNFSNQRSLNVAEHEAELSVIDDNMEALKRGDDSTQNTTSPYSPTDFKQQTKRRRSALVRQGSITTESLKHVLLDEVYQVHKQLGTGRFGYIKLARHKESGCNIALKFFPRPQTKQVNFIREYNYSYFLSPHPNIIDTYQGTYQTDDESAYFFVQEFCPCASLREAVEDSSSGIGENATKTIMQKVLAAIEFMHNENLVHRNLKAENVLIFDRSYNKVKVTDFGLTRKVGSSVRYLEYVNIYHAPELCETVVNETLIVDRSIDIWAIGILIYYCLKGRFPWQKATIMCKPYWEWEQWLRRKNLQLPRRWDSFSEKSLKLFKRTLEPRYKDRWDVRDVSKCLMKEKLLKTTKVAEAV